MLKPKSVFSQVFVHCDVVICDAKKNQDGVCDKLCSKKETGIRGRLFWMYKCIQFYKLTFYCLHRSKTSRFR